MLTLNLVFLLFLVFCPSFSSCFCYVAKFLEGLHVSFDFDGAQARLEDCKKARTLNNSDASRRWRRGVHSSQYVFWADNICGMTRRALLYCVGTPCVFFLLRYSLAHLRNTEEHATVEYAEPSMVCRGVEGGYLDVRSIAGFSFFFA